MVSLKSQVEKQDNPKTIKCVVWDLDNTLWEGVLLEDEQVWLRDQVVDIIQTLDRRGILQSLVSKNEQTTMYLSDIKRNQKEKEFVGTPAEFLTTLNMNLTIAAKAEDLQRSEELTLRTNQLNTTGYTYSYDELNQFRQSNQHKLLIASLEDKYGTYGKIGLVLVECQPTEWTIKLLLMSCRVMSRGIGTVMLNYILRLAKQNSVRLRAEFVASDRDRMMYITYKFAGFKETKQQDDLMILENDLTQIQPCPEYMNVQILD